MMRLVIKKNKKKNKWNKIFKNYTKNKPDIFPIYPLTHISCVVPVQFWINVPNNFSYMSNIPRIQLIYNTL